MNQGLLLVSLGCLSACSAAPSPPENTSAPPVVTVKPAAPPNAFTTASPDPGPPPPLRPRGEMTTQFNAKVDIDPLLQAGCVKTGENLDCSQGGAVKALGCTPVSRVDDLLGALTPAAGIAECNTIARGNGSEGIVHLGCMLPVYRRLVVASGGKVELIKSASDLAARFAPVETPEEAMAFAVAVSRARPLAEVVIPPGAVVYVQHEEPTYVEKVAEGFKVHLFEFQLCGCGPHDWQSVDFLVTREGQVSEIGRVSIYADPKFRGTCVD